jgi:hypothetical protein
MEEKVSKEDRVIPKRMLFPTKQSQTHQELASGEEQERAGNDILIETFYLSSCLIA